MSEEKPSLINRITRGYIFKENEDSLILKRKREHSSYGFLGRYEIDAELFDKILDLPTTLLFLPVYLMSFRNQGAKNVMGDIRGKGRCPSCNKTYWKNKSKSILIEREDYTAEKLDEKKRKGEIGECAIFAGFKSGFMFCAKCHDEKPLEELVSIAYGAMRNRGENVDLEKLREIAKKEPY